jgi:proteasome lid subunit RPN8/RPN11
VFWIPGELGCEILQHADRDWPVEACGVLLGDSRGSDTVLTGWLPARNLLGPLEGKRGFLLDPVALLRAEREAARRGLQLLGAWHSHPGGGAEPSARDRSGNHGYDWHLILPMPISGPPRPRLWRVSGGGWSPADWRIGAPASAPVERNLGQISGLAKV